MLPSFLNPHKIRLRPFFPLSIDTLSGLVYVYSVFAAPLEKGTGRMYAKISCSL